MQKIDFSEYEITLHRHQFAAWAAARASQRAFIATKPLIEALTPQLSTLALGMDCDDSDKFDDAHKADCEEIQAFLSKYPELNKESKGKITYGRAAKLLNVYLKSLIVLPYPDEPLSHIIHPPIDRVLLQKAANLDNDTKKLFSDAVWTKFDEKKYFRTLRALKKLLPEDAPFWKIEALWIPWQEYTRGKK